MLRNIWAKHYAYLKKMIRSLISKLTFPPTFSPYSAIHKAFLKLGKQAFDPLRNQETLEA